MLAIVAKKIEDSSMSEQKSWGLIGPGNIGKELQRQLGQPEVAERVGLNPFPEFVMRTSGIFNTDGSLHQYESLTDFAELPDAVFVALPSSEDGKPAYAHITTVLEVGKLAITAEKGALANYYDELKDESDNFKRLGVNATVGGGTRLVSMLEKYCEDRDNIKQLHLSMNGTLSAIFGSIAPPEGLGMSLGQAVQQAVQLGYAEPGSQDPHAVIKEEAEGDIPKKTAILFNLLGLSKKILSPALLRFSLKDEDISQAVEEAKIRRFIVSLYPVDGLSKVSPENDIIGGFQAQHDGWLIRGGFRHTEKNPLFDPLAKLTGPGNGFVIGLGPDETDGVYSLTGPGAGVRPTVNTMIDDYLARKHLLA